MEYSLKVKSDVPSGFKVNSLGAGPGDSNCLIQIANFHPLKSSEENYNKHQLNIQMRMLRNREGLHAPMKLLMEMRSAKKIGRLPCLTSSFAQMDVLSGKDELLEFSDFLGGEEFSEYLRQPHAVVEKSLGIL